MWTDDQGSRTPFAPPPHDPRSVVRHPATPPPPGGRGALRLLVAPLAALVAAVAGLLYVLLLPICGIASMAGAAAQASWRLVREALATARTRAPRHG
jgi:hypothetical protein